MLSQKRPDLLWIVAGGQVLDEHASIRAWPDQ
jgi:hypothetical protein